MNSFKRVAVIVAHPDDETLWAGGLMLLHPGWDWFVVTACRGNDPDRAPKFFRVLGRLAAAGVMANLDDEPEQTPLPAETVQETILSLLSLHPVLARQIGAAGAGEAGMPGLADQPDSEVPRFDLLVTHGPQGEYTRHRRHEEVCQATLALWQAGKIRAPELWTFAYEDGGRQYLPQAQPGADRHELLPESVWQEKYDLITQVYGFAPESWEARTTPRQEAFHRRLDVAEVKGGESPREDLASI